MDIILKNPFLHKILAKNGIAERKPRGIKIKVYQGRAEVGGKILTWYIADIFHNYGDYLENIDTLAEKTEQELRQTIQEKHKIAFPSKRTLKNFITWYNGLREKPLTAKEVEQVKIRFNENKND